MIDINKKTRNIIFQIFIFVLEMTFVIGIFTKFSLILFPLKHILCWDLIERIIGLYTVYQIFIFATLTQIDDLEKDSYNTLKLICEDTLIYFRITNPDYKSQYLSNLINAIYAQMSQKAMNSEEIIVEYKLLLSSIIWNDVHNVEHMLNKYNHWLNHLDLKFTKSLLLRYFKNPSFKVSWKLGIIIFCCIIIGGLFII